MAILASTYALEDMSEFIDGEDMGSEEVEQRRCEPSDTDGTSQSHAYKEAACAHAMAK